MIETAVTPAKPKRWTFYDKEQRLQVFKLHEEGKTIRQIESATSIPFQTVHRWITESGTADVRERVHQSVSQVVRQAVTSAKAIANSEVQKLIDEQLVLGTLVMAKAKLIANRVTGLKHASQLASAASSAKIGKDIARQALGLDDERAMQQNIRINHLVIQSRSNTGLPDTEDVIDVTSCGVSESPLSLTPSPSDTTSEKSQ